MTNVETVHTYPAYTVVEVACNDSSDPVTAVSTKKNVRVLMGEYRDGSPRWDEFSFGSVVSYARQYDECPIEAVNECRKNMLEHPYAGHKLHWVNPCAVMLANGGKKHECFIGLHLGDVVTFEGLNFKLERAPNSNVALVEV